MKKLLVSDEKWKRIEEVLMEILNLEGYDLESSSDIAFYLRQAIQNLEPLILSLAKLSESTADQFSEEEKDELLISAHMLFQNYDNYQMGNDLIMHRKRNQHVDDK